MRFLPLSLLVAVTLYGGPKEINTFNSKFEQTITDDHKKKIVYKGELWASKPQNALWVYQKPIQKSVYINGSKIIILEPSLEQATIRKLDGDIDFLSIVQNAKKIDASRYMAKVKGEEYSLYFKDDTLTSISYTDNFDNKIVINFLSPQQNKPIESSRFKPLIPADYDILSE